MQCKKCGTLLDHDEIAVYKKIINREAREFWCKHCLAEYCGCDTAIIDKKIAQFKANGCLLFAENGKQ